VAAATYKTPVQILDALTPNLTEAQILAERQAGKTLSQIATEQNVFDAFIAKVKEARILMIQSKVKDGTLTQARADLMIKYINEHVCDGTQAFGMRTALNNGEKFGLGFGKANGEVRGQGLAQGTRPADGTGRGMMRGLGGRGLGGNCLTGTSTAQ
jgi:hypothetical protein